MTPYQRIFPARVKMLLLPLFFLALGVNLALAGDSPKPSPFEALTRSGFEHYYSLEYDKAISDFQKAIEASPDDARGYNHLLEAILFRELYKHDALDTSLYTQDGFLNSKQIVLDGPV